MTAVVFFFEAFNAREFARQTGVRTEFVQDNHSRSIKGVLRGLHYQVENTQGKLVRVVHGEIRDVAVDVRKSSPTFGQWVAVHLSADNHRQLWVPPGFAHGFAVMSESAEFLYKTTDYYNPAPTAASAGTTRNWPSTGGCSNHRCCRTRTSSACHWQRRNCCLN